MNNDLITWIWQQSKADSSTALVEFALACKANFIGEATVTLAELAQMTRMKEEEIRISLRYAVKLGELQILQNTDQNGKRTANTYKFTIMASLHRHANGEDDIQFDDPLPGIEPPKVRDLPRPAQPKIMMDATQLAQIEADPLYKGLDVKAQAWKFKRWCRAKGQEETVRRFRTWLSRV